MIIQNNSFPRKNGTMLGKGVVFMHRNAILYGQLTNGLQKKTLETLSRILMDYCKVYPVCLEYDSTADYTAYRCFYIGTKVSNPYIAQNSNVLLSAPESYHICVKDDRVIIEGFDDAGALYGCIDFYNKYIIRYEYANEADDVLAHTWHNIFADKLPDFAHTSAPTVSNRGIWTWGHVIYDFRGFIDHMVKLKMNTLIVWNDFVPVNAKEMIAYAHNSNVRVIWGFAWGWDTHCKDLSLKTLDGQTEEIFSKFKKEFAGLDIDGIYFQSITEVKTEYMEGILVADAVTDFVNRTAKLFFEVNPELELQFGLHATSVKNRLDVIKRVDPRIRIVWEDCGAIPFSYFPHIVENFDETKAFAKQAAALRGADDKFGAVTKGFTKLSWTKFEHLTGPIFLGTSPDSVQRDKIIERQKVWKYFQAYWLKNGAKALEIIKAMADAKDGDLYITALVEDGMFEKNLMYPVALYSEMLWDCNADFQDLMSEVALRSDVVFA